MTQELSTCLWFDKKAKEAFQFYKDVFGDVELLSENPMAVVYKIYGRRFMNFNGGPEYSINPSISFFISAAKFSIVAITVFVYFVFCMFYTLLFCCLQICCSMLSVA